MTIDFNKVKNMIKEKDMTVEDYIKLHPDMDLSIPENLDAFFDQATEEFLGHCEKTDPDNMDEYKKFIYSDPSAVGRETMRLHGLLPEETDPFLKRYDKKEYIKSLKLR